jgi:hypothetical protein
VRVKDERGVIGAMVALLMVVLLGMVALSLDFGLMFVKRRGMVGANDAAALAFAESCALRYGLADAESSADQLAKANVSDANEAEPYVLEGDCDGTGQVTVHYQGEQKLFFAPIVGFDSQTTISTTATAAWGPAGGMGGVLPVMLSEGRLTTCDIPFVDPGTVCYFYVDNGEIGNGEWALLNVQPDPSLPKFGWDVEDVNYNCPAFSDSEMRDIIANGSPQLSLDYPEPTYVCRVPGAHTPTFRDVEDLEGETRLFPVNDPAGQIMRGGEPAPPESGLTPDFYDIVGFTVLQIENVMRGTDRDWDTNCPGDQNSNAWCLKAVWVDYTLESGEVCADCPDFGIRAINLTG